MRTLKFNTKLWCQLVVYGKP